LQQQQQQQPDQLLALAGNGLRSIRTHSRPISSKWPSSATAGNSSSIIASPSWAVPGSVASKFACFEDYLAAREYELYVELGPGQGVSELIAASHAAALSNGPQVGIAALRISDCTVGISYTRVMQLRHGNFCAGTPSEVMIVGTQHPCIAYSASSAVFCAVFSCVPCTSSPGCCTAMLRSSACCCCCFLPLSPVPPGCRLAGESRGGAAQHQHAAGHAATVRDMTDPSAARSPCMCVEHAPLQLHQPSVCC
jgi:hypothetical protein